VVPGATVLAVRLKLTVDEHRDDAAGSTGLSLPHA
jgi:hypothetical protein